MVERHLAQGVPLINAAIYRSLYSGAGTAVAICDTGIDYTHPMLGGGSFPNSKVLGGYDFGDADPDPMPVGEAHGTSCAGLAAGDPGTVGDYIGGVAYDAKLYALKISPDNSGSASNDAIVAAWDWCVTHRNDDPAHPIMVISTSFGGGRYFSTCDTVSPAMATSAQNAEAAGIIVVASSGNDGYCDSMALPACISNVVSVGAVYDAAFGTVYPCVSADSCATRYADATCPTGYYAIDVSAGDFVTSYSNSASNLTVFAPANQAYTTDIVGSDGYATGDYTGGFGGTSASSPYVAGVVSCVQQAALELTGSFLTPQAMKTTLTSTGNLITDPKVPGIVKPRVNMGRAIDTIFPCEGQKLTIFNDGDADLVITSISASVWISLSPTPAAPYTLTPGASIGFCVTTDCEGCTPGEILQGAIEITSNDAAGDPEMIPVDVVCPVPGDFDIDGDVDQDDVDAIMACLTGAAIPVVPDCEAMDLDGDNDSDIDDYGMVQRCLSGENNPGDPSCAD
jgi:hypothetical protein